jgi:hypothetical protein
MVVAGAVITGVPIMPPSQALQRPEPHSLHPPSSPQGEQGLQASRRPNKLPQPPMPQQPSDALVKTARVVTISSLLMAGFSNTKRKRGEGGWVAQLYNTLADVQTQRAGFFSQPDCLFTTPVRGIGGMFFGSGSVYPFALIGRCTWGAGRDNQHCLRAADAAGSDCVELADYAIVIVFRLASATHSLVVDGAVGH